jgi:dipeptidyl aminopeptidase/acylaminoacyl peptidase
VSDIAALAEATHRFEAHYPDTLVGPPTDTARFARLSPIHRAHRMSVPLLVFHGADDPVVPVAHSAELVERINAHGGSAQLTVYEGERHGFRATVNQVDELHRTERFLQEVLAAGPAG